MSVHVIVVLLFSQFIFIFRFALCRDSVRCVLSYFGYCYSLISVHLLRHVHAAIRRTSGVVSELILLALMHSMMIMMMLTTKPREIRCGFVSCRVVFIIRNKQQLSRRQVFGDVEHRNCLMAVLIGQGSKPGLERRPNTGNEPRGLLDTRTPHFK